MTTPTCCAIQQNPYQLNLCDQSYAFSRPEKIDTYLRLRRYIYAIVDVHSWNQIVFRNACSPTGDTLYHWYSDLRCSRSGCRISTGQYLSLNGGVGIHLEFVVWRYKLEWTDKHVHSPLSLKYVADYPAACTFGWTCSPVSPPYYYQCLPSNQASTPTTNIPASTTPRPGTTTSVPTPTGAAPILSTVGNGYRVDTRGGLVFDVDKSSGSITNLNFNGVQYQDSSKLSAINSGLGTSSVSAETIGSYVKITAKSNGLPVTHYYVAKPGDPTIYMATYITGEVDPGELRWLARMKKSVLPKGWHDPASEIAGCTAFEGKDTFRCPNDQTRCKFYSSDRFIDDIVHGVTGNNVGIWMIMPGNAYETSSGGPFMRDINTQGDDQQELYFYMNSGHIRTEPWRFGLMGPYAMKYVLSSVTRPTANPETLSPRFT